MGKVSILPLAILLMLIPLLAHADISLWSLNYQGAEETYNNHYRKPIKLRIYVNNQINSDGKLYKSDTVTLLCKHSLHFIKPGSSILCELPPDTVAKVFIIDEYYKNGATGIFDITY